MKVEEVGNQYQLRMSLSLSLLPSGRQCIWNGEMKGTLLKNGIKNQKVLVIEKKKYFILTCLFIKH